jgi:hypothetical protein
MTNEHCINISLILILVNKFNIVFESIRDYNEY